MGLSSDLISEFVKVTNDNQETKKESIVYGTTVSYEGKTYVKIDGSDRLTPISTVVDTQPGERVTVMIKNHTATITGNMSAPAARIDDVNGINSEYKKLNEKITEFDIVLATKVDTESFNSEKARIDYLVSDNTIIRQTITAANADISDLKADNVTIHETLTAAEANIETLKTTKLDATIADIKYATITNLDAVSADLHDLESTYAAFHTTATEKLTAHDADIEELQTKKLDVETAKVTYANIDFSNITKAAMQYLYSESGLIEDVVIGDATITGKLVGVTISGSLIEGATVVADKLVIKGDDGLYYKLNTDGVKTETEQTDYNSLNGEIIKAKSVTASKISVDDLVAFDATIAGLNLTNSTIYSGVKESVDNTTAGFYLDKDGQMAVGDGGSFIKYYKDQNGDYHLEISAQSVVMSTQSASEEDPQPKTVEAIITELAEATVEATETANAALSEAKSYTDSQLSITTESITSSVTESIVDLQAISDSSNDAIIETKTLLEQLADSISTLVTDSNGESLMVQTESGWTFSTAKIQSVIDSTSDDLNTLMNEVGDVSSTVNILQQAVGDLGVLSDYVKIRTYEEEPCIELGESDSDFKLLITNTRILFMEGSGVPAYMTNRAFHIKKAVVEEELLQGGFVWKIRSNGNMGLMWKGVSS